jgi:hypothetical protein
MEHRAPQLPPLTLGSDRVPTSDDRPARTATDSVGSRGRQSIIQNLR